MLLRHHLAGTRRWVRREVVQLRAMRRELWEALGLRVVTGRVSRLIAAINRDLHRTLLIFIAKTLGITLIYCVVKMTIIITSAVCS